MLSINYFISKVYIETENLIVQHKNIYKQEGKYEHRYWIQEYEIKSEISIKEADNSLYLPSHEYNIFLERILILISSKRHILCSLYSY